MLPLLEVEEMPHNFPKSLDEAYQRHRCRHQTEEVEWTAWPKPSLPGRIQILASDFPPQASVPSITCKKRKEKKIFAAFLSKNDSAFHLHIPQAVK